MTYTGIPKKYQKYLSNTTLKHAIFLDKENKLPYGNLHNMTPHDACSIVIHVRTMKLAGIGHKQKE